MTAKALSCSTIVAAGITVFLFAGQPPPSAQQNDPALRVGPTDLGGVVTSANGPEAGVWVIAETTDLPTKFAKIVVTDDRGRYVMPDLPKASYSVWVRGYGLIDSPKLQTAPGKMLDLTRRGRAEPGRGRGILSGHLLVFDAARCRTRASSPAPAPTATASPPAMKSQAEWLNVVKTNGCDTCHQLGNQATRTIPRELGDFATSDDAWAAHPVGPGHDPDDQHPRPHRAPRALKLVRRLDRPHRRRRAARRDAAAAAGRRAQRRAHALGLGRPKAYLHDEVSTDKRNPRSTRTA